MPRRRKLTVTGGVCLAVLFALPAAAAPSTDPAGKAVSYALGRKLSWTDQSVGTSERTRFRKTIALSGPSGYAGVDAETGILVEFQSSEPPESATGAPRLSAEQAEAAAVAFLQRAGVPVRGAWTLTENQYLDHGSAGREYLLNWSRFFHGVDLPAFLSVGVDADSGKIRTYTLVDDPVVIPLQSRLTGADAARLVAQKAGYARPILESARPRIWYQPGYPGPQALFWEVRLRNPDARTARESCVAARVNAMTGEIVSMAVPAGTAPVASAGNAAKKRLLSLPRVDLKAARKARMPPTIFESKKHKRQARKRQAGWLPDLVNRWALCYNWRRRVGT